MVWNLERLHIPAVQVDPDMKTSVDRVTQENNAGNLLTHSFAGSGGEAGNQSKRIRAGRNERKGRHTLLSAPSGAQLHPRPEIVVGKSAKRPSELRGLLAYKTTLGTSLRNHVPSRKKR